MRRNAEQIQALWMDSSSIVLPVFRLGNLIDASECKAVMRERSSLGELVSMVTEPTFLGRWEDKAVFSFVCGEEQASEWECLKTEYGFSDLRSTGPMLPRAEASILAYARGISHWQSLNRFCAACGSTVSLQGAGHMLTCVSPDCGRQWFPRTDPAVIMLIERVDNRGRKYCLLGRSPQWPDEVFSTLAGFVETGESLEQAVIREVFEEAGVVVDNVQYITSQPWPFPQSLMVGFIGTAMSRELKIDTNELADARWFEAGEISTFGNWGDDTAGPKLPRPDSIARHLIDRWVSSSE